MEDSVQQRREIEKERIYLDFYAFAEVPFATTPDPQFLFRSDTHQSVLDKILYGIQARMGFILLSGEVGTGKTTICRCILDSLHGQAETVYIINPSLTGLELLSTILQDLRVDCPKDGTKKELIDRLNDFLLETASHRPVVIVVDDAQTMPMEALEDLRLLSNLETDKEKLIQIVLAGQPELIDRLSRPELRQFVQRVGISCHLDHLAEHEIDGYIARRLFISGEKGRLRFTRGAVRRIFKASRGIPRLINKICDYSLTAGYVDSDFRIRASHVRRALKELGPPALQSGAASATFTGSGVSRRRKPWIWAAAAAASAVLIFLGFHPEGIVPFKQEADSFAKDRQENAPARQEAAALYSPDPVLEQIGKAPMRASRSTPPPGGKAEGVSFTGGAGRSLQTPSQAPPAVQKPFQDRVAAGRFHNPAEALKSDDDDVFHTTAPDANTGTVTASTRSVAHEDGKIAFPEPDARFPVSLLLGSYRTAKSARNAVAIFGRQVETVHWSPVDVEGEGRWYRVFTGRFETREAARRYQKEHGLRGSLILTAPWTVVAGRADASEQLSSMQNRLQKNQYRGCLVKTPDGTHRLELGIFVSREGAEKLAGELKRLGFSGVKVARR